MEEKIELRSEEINEIFGKRPNVMVRYGILLILFILILFFSFSMVINYPQLIDAELKICYQDIETQIYSPSEGVIDSIYKSNNCIVRKDDTLASISSNNSKYLITSKIDGRLHFTYFWSKNTEVTNKQHLFNIVPANFDNLIGILKVPINSKLKTMESKYELGSPISVFILNNTELHELKSSVLDKIISADGNFFYLKIEMANLESVNYATYNTDVSVKLIVTRHKLYQILFHAINNLTRKETVPQS